MPSEKDARRTTHGIDLTDVEKGDRLTVELESGETFDNGIVSEADIDVARNRHEKTLVSLSYENDFWEQVNDRVESEVLTISQRSKRGGDPLEQPKLIGVYWVGDVEEMKTPRYKTLGKIKLVERHGQ